MALIPDQLLYLTEDDDSGDSGDEACHHLVGDESHKSPQFQDPHQELDKADQQRQGGDPTGTGAGGPGYKFEDEVYDNPLKHETNSISMANAGPNSNGSQFFITHSPQSHLDGKHTVFGKVVSGADVVDAIREGDKMEKVEVSEVES